MQNNKNNGSPLTIPGSKRKPTQAPDYFNNKQLCLDYKLRPRTQEKTPYRKLTSKIHSYISTLNINKLIQLGQIQRPSQLSGKPLSQEEIHGEICKLMNIQKIGEDGIIAELRKNLGPKIPLKNNNKIPNIQYIETMKKLFDTHSLEML